MESTLKRAVLLFALCASLASAQVTMSTINPSEAVVSISLPKLNANFTALNGKQIIGPGVPSPSLCTSVTVGTLGIRSDAGAGNASLFVCVKNTGSTFAWEGPYNQVGPAGATGANGGTGPAPAGTGFVHVTGGVLDVPSNTIPAASLPVPTVSTLGGVKSLTCSTGFHLGDIDTTGTPHCTADTGTGGSSGTVTHTAGALTATAIVTGNGGADVTTPASGATVDTGGNMILPGKLTSNTSCAGCASAIDLVQGTDPGGYPVNAFSWTAPPSIPASYRWMPPAADAAGAMVSDGAATPGHVSLVPFSGTGNILKQTTPTLTQPILTNYTVGTLPAGVTSGKLAYVTDGSTSSDCTIGGGSNKVLCAYNGAAWAFPGGAAVGGSTACGGQHWVFGGPPAYAPFGQTTNTGVSHAAEIFAFAPQCGWTSSHITYTVSAAAAGTAGILFAIYNDARTSQLCVSTVGVTTNVTVLGTHSLTWASGADVTGGVCSLPLLTSGSYRIVQTSDDTTLAVFGYYEAFSTSMMAANSTTNAGSNSSVSSGIGAALTLPSSLSSVTWATLAGYQAGVPALLVE